ncbi:unnamed protein product [Calypogeia fissa]
MYGTILYVFSCIQLGEGVAWGPVISRFHAPEGVLTHPSLWPERILSSSPLIRLAPQEGSPMYNAWTGHLRSTAGWTGPSGPSRDLCSRSLVLRALLSGQVRSGAHQPTEENSRSLKGKYCWKQE